VLVLAGCASPVTGKGEKVRQVQPGIAGCKFLGVVRVEGSLVYGTMVEAKRDMLNRLRNATAEAGGNGYVAREMIVERGFGLPYGEVEAYSCD
jgi:hypothetical protein